MKILNIIKKRKLTESSVYGADDIFLDREGNLNTLKFHQDDKYQRYNVNQVPATKANLKLAESFYGIIRKSDMVHKYDDFDFINVKSEKTNKK